IEFAVQSLDAETHELFLGQDRVRVKTYAQGERVAVFSAEGSAVLTEVDVIAHAGDCVTEGGRLTDPMPGKRVAFLAQGGDTISKGPPLAVMEAMKMEHTTSSPLDGKVAELLFAVGDQVTDGAELLKL
ncbi:acetyl-CoA carboxylase biotin carboxyl carrier protein subunit, partial [Escherichia coli]|uniref:acetyl-CoA carboxylase biotin carboxyl carrier protein subunit n=1 Tax=Escherichia coli TaxID=562 RepID=UPI003208B787